MDQLDNLISVNEFSPESVVSVMTNLLLCMLLLTFVSWFYRRYSRSLGGKLHIGSVLPLVGLTVFLVILVVKSSLALSLGLVGALSIVRFRTPIKEPEELGYLFLTIAIGLGLGAGFTVITIAVVIAIIGYLWLTSGLTLSGNPGGEYCFAINLDSNSPATIEEITSIIRSYCVSLKITRVESADEGLSIFYNVSIEDDLNMDKVFNKIKSRDPGCSINLVEHSINW
jgi:hypothetical protein